MLRRLIELEPVKLRGLVMTTAMLLTILGVKLIPGLDEALLAWLLALFPVVQWLWTRGAVTPNATVAVRVPDPDKPGVIEAGDATTTASGAAIITAARSAGDTVP
jgi:hypothetical protein